MSAAGPLPGEDDNANYRGARATFVSLPACEAVHCKADPGTTPHEFREFAKRS